ncbi:hypothetical protein CH370_15005 [Leptospira kmetyi]|uniref:DUF1564 family protein n=1 Tax=Leptospira kmetyi TaxID=408139 RepID=UPI000C29A16A|nr:hypothetical protein CH370_15005 [Leptospira kmetyi]
MRSSIYSVNRSIASSLNISKITCTFLVPLKIVRQLPNSEQKRIGKNLGGLLKTHAHHLTRRKRFNNRALTIKYQKQGNSLIKFNARIHAEEWAQLSVLAASHGISRCLLYCFLIQLQLSSLSKRYKKSKGTYGYKVRYYSFVWSLNLKTKKIQRILYE